MDKQNWSSQVASNSQCSLYKTFKNDLSFENYLVSLNSKDRITLCRLRCRSHTLPVCANRFSNGPDKDVICPLCNLKEVGDEFHYIFTCPHFSKERHKYLMINDAVLNSPRPEDIFMGLHYDENALKGLCIFIRIIMSSFEKAPPPTSGLRHSKIPLINCCFVTSKL